MTKLNYNQLYYFYVVATEGSVKAACNRLHLTQPTISGQLRALEDDLGFELFDRKSRRLILNSRGKSILKRAEKIFALGDELLATLPRIDFEEKRRISVGLSPSLSESFVTQFSRKVLDDQQNRLDIHTGEIESLVDKLNRDEIDIILSDSPISRTGGHLRSINLSSEKVVVVGSEDFIEAKKGFPNSMNGLPFIELGRGGQLASDVSYFLRIKNIQPETIASVDNVHYAKRFATLGYGLCALPLAHVREEIRSGDLIRIGGLGEISSSTWAMVSRTANKNITIRKTLNKYFVGNTKKPKE